MQEQMILQIGMFGEASTADVTSIRPGTIMDVHM